MSIGIVVDSTADIPESLVAQHNIIVVPAFINVGQASYADGVDLSRREFYRRLPTFSPHPTTAAPAAAAYQAAYEQLAAAGATAVISVHIAASLSNIYNAARLGAADSPIPVHLFDTGQLSLGQGWFALLAAEAAAAGAALDDILTLLADRRARAVTVAGLDTLEYLRQGGRVSLIQFGLGTLLQIKPIILVESGEITVLERVRTRRRQTNRLPELAAIYGPYERLAVLHANVPAEAEALQAALTALLPAGQPPITVEATPAIGVHVGPGALGFTAIRAAAP